MESPPEEREMSGLCGTWGKGGYKTLLGQVFYAKCSSTVALCYHHIEEAPEFSVQAKRSSDGSLENIHVKFDSIEIEVSAIGINVNSELVTVPYMNKKFHIHKSGIYTKITSHRNILSLTFSLRLSHLDIHLEKSFKTGGLLGESKLILEKDLEAFFSKYVIGHEDTIEIPRSLPPVDGTAYCAGVIRRNFLQLEPEDQDNYINICAYEYNDCEDTDKRSCACSTFTNIAFLCGKNGCSDSLSAWRKDQHVVCGAPVCPKTQIFDECSPISQRTCSNLSPSEVVEVVAGCTCPEGLVLNDIGIGPINQCVDINDCPCSYGGIFYQPGSSRESTCNSKCQCVAGEWKCSDAKCPGTCKIEEGLYVTTYDDKKYNLFGNCEYIVSHDDSWLISVNVAQTANAQSTSSINSITLLFNRNGKVETKFVIRKDGVISNSDIYDQNHYKSDQLSFLRMDDHIHFAHFPSRMQLLVTVKPMMQLYISVPEGLENTKGLCGSYNNKGDDDFLTNQNIVESLPEVFFSSWTLSSCQKPDPPTCISFDNVNFAEEHCSRLKDPNGPFARCHFDVDYRSYYDRCVESTCISEDLTAGLCTALKNYALACAENNIFIKDWRSNICEKTCKNNQVLQYSYGSCFRTCFLSSSNEQCDKQQGLVAEICGCPDGQYLNSDETCVTKSECDCFHVSDVISAHQKIEIDGRQCECVDGKIDCRSNISEFPELCSGNAEFVDCSFPNNQRRIDLDCSTKNLPIISDDDECKPGYYCRFGMVRDSKGNCVPFTDCPCLYGGQEYASGRSVNISCNQCVCTKGTWKCSFDDCQTTCSVFGDGHFQTFDGMWYTYDGVCQYTLAQDNIEGTFRISVHSVPCCEEGLTCSRNIIIHVKGAILTLEDGKVNSDHSKSDCSSSDSYSVTKTGTYIIITLLDGLSVIWDKGTSVSVTMSPVWNNKVGGLCGNSNGDMKDDFTARNGIKVTRAVDMGYSWNEVSTCLDTEAQKFPCDINPYCKPWAQRKCQIIKDAVFKDCHSKVDPTSYYESCMREACVGDMEGKYLGFCTSVSKYAHACIAVGVCVNWRNPDLCPMCCDYYNAKRENIWHYEPCGATYVKTCSNQEIFDKFAPFLEGCYPTCPPGAPYLDQNVMQCVPLSKCSCLHNGQVIAANSMIYDHCDKQCYCINGNVICQEKPTPTPTEEPTQSTFSHYKDEPSPPTPSKYTDEPSKPTPLKYIGCEPGSPYCIQTESGEYIFEFQTEMGCEPGSPYCVQTESGEYIFEFPIEMEYIFEFKSEKGCEPGSPYCVQTESGEYIFEFQIEMEIPEHEPHIGCEPGSPYCVQTESGEYIFEFKTEKVHEPHTVSTQEDVPSYRGDGETPAAQKTSSRQQGRSDFTATTASGYHLCPLHTKECHRPVVSNENPDCCSSSGDIINAGETWEIACIVCTCDGKTGRMNCAPRNCNQYNVCLKNERRVFGDPAKISGDSCCGHCEPITCKHNGAEVQIGETIRDSEDPCIVYTCEDTGLSVFVDECPKQKYCTEDRRIYDGNRCCYTCDNSCKPSPSPIDLVFTYPDSDEYSVITCSAFVTMATCNGECEEAKPRYDLEEHKIKSDCHCCNEASSEDQTIELTCEDRTPRTYTYKHITSCSCHACSVAFTYS
ncbi:mucin-19 [Ranitomeya variabilis]|uniref:mucin-19 n=1 Tax=Ranitomeya variabilis TaxID=490064 RepID=UPI004056EF8C